MAELEARLKEARVNARNIIVVTDGVFSMDGYVAQIDKTRDLADAYEAMVMVDECHATGFIGKTTRLHRIAERARPRGHHRHWARRWCHGWVHDRKARDH